MSNEELLTTMFAVHGKRPMDAQFNEYLKIFDRLGNEKSRKLFKHVRDDEDKFPTIKQVWGIINSLGLINREQSQLKTYDDCYFCGGVGYVPRLISPKQEKTIRSYTTVVYACKCSAGQDLPKSYIRYFDIFGDLQFKEVKEGANYPQLVNHLQIKYNNELHKEKSNGKRINTRRSDEYSEKLGASELAKEIEEIAGINTEDED